MAARAALLRSPRPRPLRLRSVLGLVAAIAGLSACTGGPGSEEDLVIALTRDDTFTEEEAVCIANAVFEEYGEDEEALNRISGTLSYEDLTGPDGIDGFEEAFDQMVRACDAPG